MTEPLATHDICKECPHHSEHPIFKCKKTALYTQCPIHKQSSQILPKDIIPHSPIWNWHFGDGTIQRQWYSIDHEAATRAIKKMKGI